LVGYADEIQRLFQEQSAQGFRTLGLTAKPPGGRRDITAAAEAGMTLRGFITLSDSPKEGIRHTLGQLEALGIQLKMITGDMLSTAAVGLAVLLLPLNPLARRGPCNPGGGVQPLVPARQQVGSSFPLRMRTQRAQPRHPTHRAQLASASALPSARPEGW